MDQKDYYKDWDKDGINNIQEVQAGLDPLNRDTDGDGILDREEVLLGTNPRLQESLLNPTTWKDLYLKYYYRSNGKPVEAEEYQKLYDLAVSDPWIIQQVDYLVYTEALKDGLSPEQGLYVIAKSPYVQALKEKQVPEAEIVDYAKNIGQRYYNYTKMLKSDSSIEPQR